MDVIQRGRRELERGRVDVIQRGGESWKEVRVDVIQRGRRELERGKSGCDTEGEETVGKR